MKNNPCENCICNVDEYCRCEKLSLYETYQQGKADGFQEALTSNGINIYVDKIEADGARKFAEWLEDNSYLNWVGEGNDVNSMSAEEVLAEWQKGN